MGNERILPVTRPDWKRVISSPDLTVLRLIPRRHSFVRSPIMRRAKVDVAVMRRGSGGYEEETVRGSLGGGTGRAEEVCFREAC